MKIKWSELGRKFGLKGPDDTVELADDAPGLSTVDTSRAGGQVTSGTISGSRAGEFTLMQEPDPETERLRKQVADSRRREEERIRRDSQSFAALAVRDEKAPPYVAEVLAAEYEAMALADLDRPLAEGVSIKVGETACVTRVEALAEHYKQMRPGDHTRRQVLDRARVVSNGSEGRPSEEDEARERGRALARQLNGRK